tara:strand:+ start:858 stop:1916 length:1059 start_codon:yes stop_codon:yes gene_type:complete
MRAPQVISKLNGTKIVHRNWQLALGEAFAALSLASPGDVVCITGPSRAGKTKLISELVGLLCGEIDFERDGILPAVVVDAENTGPHGRFSTKAFTLKLHQAVRHPIYGTLGEEFNDGPANTKAERTNEPTLRFALENAFRLRKTRFLFVDEAQHVRYVSKDSQGGYAVMDSWKCMAKTCGLVLVVVGAYPILQVIGHSPHMIGRKSQIHLPRYYATDHDLAEFGKILATYDQIIADIATEQVLTQSAEMLYHGSLGCIGLLRNWLGRAVARSHATGKQLSPALLREVMFSKADLAAISEEIYQGEKLFEPADTHSQSSRDRATKVLPPKSKGKPFQRKPKRYAPGNRTGGDG